MKKLTIDQLNALKFTVTDVEIESFEEGMIEAMEDYDERGETITYAAGPENWGTGRVTMKADSDLEEISLKFDFQFTDRADGYSKKRTIDEAGDFDISLNNYCEHRAEFIGFIVVDEDCNELDENGVISELDESHWIHDAYRSFPKLSKEA